MRIPKKISDINQDIFSDILYEELSYACMNEDCDFSDESDEIIYKLIDFEFAESNDGKENTLCIGFNCGCLECGWEREYDYTFYIKKDIDDVEYPGRIRELFDLLSTSGNPYFKIKVIKR